MYQILDGKKVSDQIKNEIAIKVNEQKKVGGKVPHLAAILVGTDGASETYVNHKVKACNQVGFDSTLYRYDDDISEEELLNVIKEVNNNSDIDGLIVQLPLPKHILKAKVVDAILPEKDVDGFHHLNFGRMCSELPAHVPATPLGILELLKRYRIQTKGKHCVVVGRSNIVGLPVSILLSGNNVPGNATVTMCHKYTRNLKFFTKMADILIVAVGKPGLITADMVKNRAIVVDVGITRVKDETKKSGFSLKGDVDFEAVAPKCSFITPVPGGVGPMTIAALLMNTWQASSKNIAIKA